MPVILTPGAPAQLRISYSSSRRPEWADAMRNARSLLKNLLSRNSKFDKEGVLPTSRLLVRVVAHWVHARMTEAYKQHAPAAPPGAELCTKVTAHFAIQLLRKFKRDAPAMANDIDALVVHLNKSVTASSYREIKKAPQPVYIVPSEPPSLFTPVSFSAPAVPVGDVFVISRLVVV